MIHEAIFDTKMTRMGATAKEGRGEKRRKIHFDSHSKRTRLPRVNLGPG